MNLDTFKRWKDATDARERKRLGDRLVMDNWPFVKAQIRKHAKRSSVTVDPDDLLQAGTIGLMRALEKYDPSRGAFTTYAAHWIRYEVQRCQEAELLVGRGRHAGMPYATHKASERFRTLHGREPDADDLGVDAAALDKWKQGPVTISTEESAGAWDERSTLGDFLESGDRPAEEAEAADLAHKAHALLPTLRENERTVIVGLYIEAASVDDMAARLGVTRNWINVLRKAACEKLRKGLEAA